MINIQLVDKYNRYSEDQLSFDSHLFKNPSFFNIYLKSDVTPSVLLEV